jgi:hypothetical protein
LKISHWSKVDTRWYLGVSCAQCHVPILFALDYSDGEAERQPLAAGKLVLTCTQTDCRHKADYTAASVSRFQKEPGAAQEPRRTIENRKN